MFLWCPSCPCQAFSSSFLCSLLPFCSYSFSFLQHHQRVCTSLERRAQDFLAACTHSPSQSEVFVLLPPSTGVLRGPVLRERPVTHRARKGLKAQSLFFTFNTTSEHCLVCDCLSKLLCLVATGVKELCP